MKKDIFDKLFKAALKAHGNAYCPYSKFPVGAALLTSDGNIYAGTNVEDAGVLAIHAEQSAMVQMVAAQGASHITHMVVVGGKPDDGMACSPCGHCRQSLVEFAGDDTEIVSAGPKGDIRLETTLGTLVPYAFRLRNVLKA